MKLTTNDFDEKKNKRSDQKYFLKMTAIKFRNLQRKSFFGR